MLCLTYWNNYQYSYNYFFIHQLTNLIIFTNQFSKKLKLSQFFRAQGDIFSLIAVSQEQLKTQRHYIFNVIYSKEISMLEKLLKQSLFKCFVIETSLWPVGWDIYHITPWSASFVSCHTLIHQKKAYKHSSLTRKCDKPVYPTGSAK